MIRGNIKDPIRGGLKSEGSPSTPTPTSIPGVLFDGTHDHLQSESSFDIVSSKLLARLSIRVDGGDDASRIIVSGLSNTILIGLNAENRIQITISEDPDLGPSLIAESASTYEAGPNWLNILIAVDTNAPAGSKIIQLYVNDEDDLGIVDDDGAAFEIGNPIKFNIGSYDFDANKWDGCMAGLWIGLDQYLDISVTGNRREFIDVDGKPVVNLGASGQVPTGTSPTVYLNNPYTTFFQNKGTSGNFRIFGALTEADTGPND